MDEPGIASFPIPHSRIIKTGIPEGAILAAIASKLGVVDPPQIKLGTRACLAKLFLVGFMKSWQILGGPVPLASRSNYLNTYQ